jgi:hypothetical protein
VFDFWTEGSGWGDSECLVLCFESDGRSESLDMTSARELECWCTIGRSDFAPFPKLKKKPDLDALSSPRRGCLWPSGGCWSAAWSLGEGCGGSRASSGFRWRGLCSSWCSSDCRGGCKTSASGWGSPMLAISTLFWPYRKGERGDRGDVGSEGSRAERGTVSPRRELSLGRVVSASVSGCGAALRPIPIGAKCQGRRRATWLRTGLGVAGRVPDLRCAHSAATKDQQPAAIAGRGAVTQCRGLRGRVRLVGKKWK